MVDLVYWNINDHNIPASLYLKFLKEFYKNDDEVILRFKRVKWYQQYIDYKILLAISDGEIVGQGCAYKCTVVIKDKEEEWWWGIDNFVLLNKRGKGIGKLLQRKLHNDLHNFSSLWYSPTNGVIKKKCGANVISRIKFNYYPVNNYFCFLISAFVKKLFNKCISFNHLGSNLYYLLNKPLKANKIVREIDFPNPDYNIFIKKCLEKYDIYIKRDYNYLLWKYKYNPTLNYCTLGIYENDGTSLLGIVTFTNAFNRNLYGIKMKVIAILDVFISPISKMTNKEIIYYVIEYSIRNKIQIDGIITLLDASYFPLFRYPINGTPLLSTNNTICSKPYFGYSDQDMEQMI